MLNQESDNLDPDLGNPSRGELLNIPGPGGSGANLHASIPKGYIDEQKKRSRSDQIRSGSFSRLKERVATITHRIEDSDFDTDDELQNFAHRGRENTNYNTINTDPDDIGDVRSNSSSEFSSSIFTPAMADRLRRRLKFHFMNPCEKWKARHRFPWKLSLQLLKVLFVTAQLTIFGSDRTRHVMFLEKNGIAMKHLYLKEWNPTFETMPYPPTNGVFGVYTKEGLFDGVNFALRRYNETKEIAIGSYDYKTLTDGYVPPMEAEIMHYKTGDIFASNDTFIYDSKRIRNYFKITPVSVFNTTTNTTEKVFDFEKFLQSKNYSINFDSLIHIRLRFVLKTIHLKALSDLDSPDCFQFNISILYDNEAHNGQVPISLEYESINLDCSKKSIVVHDSSAESVRQGLYIFVDIVVIIMTFVSMVLCIRSLYRAWRLKEMTVLFFKNTYDQNLDAYDRLEFLNCWMILMVVNDVLTIVGSAFKIRIETKTTQNFVTAPQYNEYDVCGMLLGTGSLLVWIGVLRYLSFFQHYNVLVLTMKKSFPDVLRFLICAAMFYLGFTFCGWVVLGPYHIKFRSIGTASECLFSLVNGDDMFVTFSAIKSTNSYIYYFSRIYLYVFISLFMYVIYSIFTSIIINTYDSIKYYYQNGFPKSTLQAFIDEIPKNETFQLYRQDSARERGCNMLCCFKCCHRHHEFPDDYEPLT